MSLVSLSSDEAERILAAAPGLPELSEEETEVAALIAKGMGVAAMARELHMTRRTVERRIQRLRTRLGVRSTAELVALLARRGL